MQKRPFLYKIILPSLIYVVLVVIVCTCIGYVWEIKLWGENFLRYDAEHYFNIKKGGYAVVNTAFFPLFPLTWKCLNLSVQGVVLLNSIVFLSSFWLLAYIFAFTRKEALFYLSIPSLFFLFIPYSESFFFISSTILLIGLSKNKENWVYLGLFLCTLGRPAYTVFVPAFLVIAALGYDSLWQSVKKIGIYFTIMLIATCIVAYIQFLDTGEWFQFFGIQTHWGNSLRLPAFPLASWTGTSLKLDSIALFVGMLAGLYLTNILYRYAIHKENHSSKQEIFALSYLVGISLLVLFFRGGSLFSLNRFVFANAFIMIALHLYFQSKISLNAKQLILLSVSSLLYWFAFGSYRHISIFLVFALLNLYIIAFFALKSESPLFQKGAYYSLVFANFCGQIYFLIYFLQGNWVA